MKSPRFLSLCALGCFLSLSSVQAATPVAQENPGEIPVALKDVGISEHLGAQVSIDHLQFLDESGKRVVLGDYFKQGRPVLMTIIYYECPNLCSFVLNGLVSSLKTMDWVPGKQFDVVAISMDPREGPELAARKKAGYLASYHRPETAAGWHFLTALPEQNIVATHRGDPPSNSSVIQLANEVGFQFRWAGDQYAHTAAVYVLTPEGKVSRYLYGIDFPEATVRLSLLEASNGKIGSIVDRVVLFCYHYDPQTKKYSPYVMHLMQAGGGVTVLFLGLFLFISWRSERRSSAVSALPTKGV
jgi:protein SCO1/2